VSRELSNPWGIDNETVRRFENLRGLRFFVVSAEWWSDRVLQQLFGETRRISESAGADTGGRAQEEASKHSSVFGFPGGCRVSAAPLLPHVWAYALPKRQTASKPAVTIGLLAFYRKRTEALLRQYLQASMQMGRTPSILGNCMFRGKVSSYRMQSFEDMVIFVFDIDKCLKKLDRFSQELVAKIALQEYSHGETAELTGQSIRSIGRKYSEAVDTLTEILLDYKLLDLD